MNHILVTVLDLGGTFVFAISGAVAAVKYRLDIFGVMVLAFAAGNVGGITRDLLIGAVPPAAISSLNYVGVSILAGLIVFFWDPLVTRHNKVVTPSAESLWLAVRIERRVGDRLQEQAYANQLRRRYPASPEYEAMQRGLYD